MFYIKIKDFKLQLRIVNGHFIYGLNNNRIKNKAIVNM